MKKYGRRPVIMDGKKRFASISEAARFVKASHGSIASLSSITSSIHQAVTGGGTVYGHAFADDTWPKTPAEYDERIERLNWLVNGLYRTMRLSCAFEQPIPPKALEAWGARIGELVEIDAK